MDQPFKELVNKGKYTTTDQLQEADIGMGFWGN